jgi:hypothetical protein
MPLFTLVVGVILDAVGIIGFVATGARSITALIPAIFGTLILICGLLAMFRHSWRKHALHVAAAVSLLGFVGVAGRSAKQWPALFAGQPVEPSATALWLQLAFALLCLIYFAACFRSFLQARFNRPANGA